MIYLGLIGPFLLIILLGILPTILALVDILKSKFEDNDKIVWLLTVLFLNFFGAILYFLIGRKQKINKI
ncbi:PLD nuclease N-terminal domain-containing protein [Tenacibaculum sp. UWU-22]|uniref:PLD nuclease N-terminal domain-containing protein n=1 Tax=Tenacibaculum sp. UWU-22 TaxID=3234187 RepID=UPI0034DB514F